MIGCRYFPAFLCFAASLSGGASAVAPYALPAPSRHLAEHPETGILAASLALGGVSFLQLNDDGEVTGEEVRADWQTLSSWPLPGGGFLLAERFGSLRLVKPDPAGSGSMKEFADWPCEGTPTDLYLHENRLFVACGAPGVMVFDWDGDTSPPRLRARYPFVDYSKGLSAFGSGDTLVVADNADTGALFLDVSETLRPRHVATFARGFVDSVSSWNGVTAVGSRHQGVSILAPGWTGGDAPLTFIPVRAQSPREAGWVRSVRFDAEGKLLICEGFAGARLVGFDTDHGEMSLAYEESLDTGGLGALTGIFLIDGKIALSSELGHLLVVTPSAR